MSDPLLPYGGIRRLLFLGSVILQQLGDAFGVVGGRLRYQKLRGIIHAGGRRTSLQSA